ncbi:ATP synthase F1 subunit gamma [Candidatus Woesebacteria bacterium]|nr:ATP synthase F1 subunit gamma [Candidatus Woesebacteria bacterium]
MANSRQVKQRISTAKNISKITKAMEMVSASKMRKAQDRAVSARLYSRTMAESLRLLAKATDKTSHPLLTENSDGKALAVVISTDRGLCGSLNQNLFKELARWRKRHPLGVVVAIGKKAITFCQYYGLELHAQFSDMPDKVTTSDIAPLSSLIVRGYLEHQFLSVSLFFMDFINTLSQQAKAEQLLPLKPVDLLDSDETLVESALHSEYVFEPNPQTILNELLPFYIENTIYQAFLEARASEHSARMVTMKNASENATELVDDLRLIYNKERQAAITSELLDITTATASLKQ